MVGGVLSTMRHSECSSGVGEFGILQIIFIVLKCIGIIDWSWWAVLIPTWIKIAIIVILAFIAVIIEVKDNGRL